MDYQYSQVQLDDVEVPTTSDILKKKTYYKDVCDEIFKQDRDQIQVSYTREEKQILVDFCKEEGYECVIMAQAIGIYHGVAFIVNAKKTKNK